MKSDLLSDRELRIFKHQIDCPAIGVAGQEKLKKCKVLVAGAGGKGSFAMQNLAASGTGFLGICDNHIVEETVIPRQTLYGSVDLGKQKAIVSKQKLAGQFPFCRFEIHNIGLSESNIQPIVSAYDLIVDATDSFASHYIIDQAAKMLCKPVVIGMLHGGIIVVSVLHYTRGHSLQEIIPSDAHFLKDTILPSLPPGQAVLYSLAGSLMANEALKIMLGFPGILDGRVLKLDTASFGISVDSL